MGDSTRSLLLMRDAICWCGPTVTSRQCSNPMMFLESPPMFLRLIWHPHFPKSRFKLGETNGLRWRDFLNDSFTKHGTVLQVKNSAAGSAESTHMAGSSTVRSSPRWPALLVLGIIALMVAFYGWKLIAVRKDAAALAPILRALFDRGGWLTVYSSSVGGSIGWVFRSALAQASVAVFGKAAAFWLVWFAVNIAATLIYVLSYFGFADAMNARPGPVQKINVFVRRWSIPVMLLLGLAPPPIPITFVLFLVASAKMSYGRFASPYAVGSAVGIAIVLYSNGTAMADPDLSMTQLLITLALPLMLVPLYQQLKKLAVRARRSRSR